MKRFWFIIIIVAGCSKADLPLTPETPTLLTVTAIDPNGGRIDSADVFIDGAQAGKTPFRAEDIRPGLHALRVSRAGYQAHTEQFVVDQGRVYVIEAVLQPLPPGEGQLIVSVNQDSVVVRVKDTNNRVIVETFERTSVHNLDPGTYLVTGEKSGGSKVEEQVEIRVGETSVVHLDLQKGPGVPPALTFWITEDSVKLGEAVNLHWQSDGVQVIIDQGIGVRGPNGSDRVICEAPGLKVFTATAYSVDALTTEKKDSVYIAPETATPPALTFSIQQDTVEFGMPADLEWQSDGWQVVIDHGVGTRGPVGSEEVNFGNPGMKVITATAYGDENLLTIKQDSLYVKDAPMPPHPIVMISTTHRVTVNTPATISWQSQNADFLVVDYVDHAELSGSVEVTFSTPGIRIVTATAFNPAGYVSAADTIEVVEPEVNTVDDILVAANSSVRADKGESGMEDLKAGTFEVETAGTYLVLAEVWYNSGDSQLNESYYLDITNGADDIFLPHDPNAGDYKVVPDEPGDPHTSTRESGIYQLDTGKHFINVYHYAKIADQYPQFINGEIDGPESVKLLGFKLVYLSQ
ncbi:MAG: PEGA domain-containing protein [bacterium]